MKKTAVQYIEKQIKLLRIRTDSATYLSVVRLFEQAKAMERQQHEETFRQSRQAKIFEKGMPHVYESFEQYFTETYGE